MSKQAIRGGSFEVLIQNSSGTYTSYSPVQERAYLGTVSGYPDATACGIVKDDGTFWGQIAFDRGGMLGILGNSVEFERSLRQPTTYKIPTTGTVSAGQIGSTAMLAWDVGADVMSNEFVGFRGSNSAAMLEFVEYSMVSMRSIWMQNARLRPYLARTIFRGSTATDPHITSPGLGTVRTEWNTNHTTADRDLVILYGRSVGAVAYSPGFYSGTNTWGYAVVPTSVSEGDWFAVQWHEIAHSWGCAHEEGNSPEGQSVLSQGEFAERGSYARFSGSELKRVLEVKSGVTSILTNQGTYTAVNLPPHAALDVAKYRQFAQTQIQIPVLANDHDANAHTLSISTHDSSSAKGGSVSQTGSGGTAQLLYSAPSGYTGTDWFEYRISDSSGQTATGVVVIDVLPDDSLAAHWKFNEATGTPAEDSSYYGRDATLVNGTLPGQTGKFGNAVSLDGTNDRIEASDLGISGANATICGWIKRPSTSQTAWAGILYNRFSGSAAALNFGTANELRYHWNGTNYNWNSGLVPPADQWVFVALVIEPTKATIYLHNGTTLQSAVNTATHTAETFAGTSTIGSDGNGRYFKGSIDDLRVYSRSLNSAEILDVVEGGTAFNPQPGNQRTEVKNGILSWARGNTSTSDRIFIGTSQSAVASATTSSAEYKGSTTAGAWTFSPAASTTYYWRVDTVTSATVIPGTVWRFTTGSEVFDSRLIARWRFNENSGTRAADVLGQNDGTLWYGTSWTTGPTGLGSAARFDGVNDHVSAPSPLLNNLSAFTIAGWYKTALTSGSSRGLWGQNDVVEFGINGSNISIWTPGGSASTPLPPANAWHHVACVGNGSSIKIYVDGTLTTTTTATASTYGNSDYPFRIGGGGIWGGSGNHFTGDIDDVRVYRGELNATEISAIYSGSSGFSAIANGPSFETEVINGGGATEGEAYSGSVAGAAGDDVSYSLVDGPEWLTVSKDGTLGGTPPPGSGGLNQFTLRAEDSFGNSSETSLVIQVDSTLLPLAWEETGIGSSRVAGPASHTGGTFTISGTGALNGKSDACHFVWQPLSGDGEIIARVATLENTGASSRVGVMIRDTLAANSRHVFMGMSDDNDYRWVRRTSLNGNTSTSGSGTGTTPATWVKMVRRGTVITSYKSSDGIAWTTVGSLSAAFPEQCYIGLAVASGSASGVNTSQFSAVSVTP